jgi:uncharacterized protein YjbI with pentapeptide repeats
MTRNKAIAAAALLVGMLLVVVVVVSDYPAGDGSISGTMADPDKKVAGVEKADRSRTPQISDADVELDDASFQQLMQNDDFVAIVTSGELALAALDRVSNELGRETLDRATSGGDFFRAATELERQGVSADFARELARAEFDRAYFDRSDAGFERMAKEFEKTAFDRALERAGLSREEMQKAGLDRESLERAGFERRDLERAELQKALERAGLNRADLERAGFDRAALNRAVSDMERATAEFNKADMEKTADLFKSEQMRADLGKMARDESLSRAIDGFYRSDIARSLARDGSFEKMTWNRAGAFARDAGLERKDLGRAE